MSDGERSLAVSALRQLIAGSGSAFIIYDLELTSWEGALARRWSGPDEFPEIVQIGAVKIADAAGYLEIESFARLIRPTRNPVLSDYFVDLTGITQNDVDTRGVPFADALSAFAQLVGTSRAFANGMDDQWVAANCALHEIENPFQPAALVNLRPQLRQAFGAAAKITSSALPALLGQANPGRAHDALADARAIAMMVRHLLVESAKGGTAPKRQ